MKKNVLNIKKFLDKYIYGEKEYVKKGDRKDRKEKKDDRESK